MARAPKYWTSAILLACTLACASAATTDEVQDCLKPLVEKLGYADGKLLLLRLNLGNYVDTALMGKVLHLSSAGPQTAREIS